MVLKKKGGVYMGKEQTILHYMESLSLSREEAEQLYRDDQEDFIGEDGERMTEAAKQIKHREKSDKPRKKTTPTRKVDKDKKILTDLLYQALYSYDNDGIVIITNYKPETSIDFSYGGYGYTFKLIKHRPLKKA